MFKAEDLNLELDQSRMPLRDLIETAQKATLAKQFLQRDPDSLPDKKVEE